MKNLHKRMLQAGAMALALLFSASAFAQDGGNNEGDDKFESSPKIEDFNPDSLEIYNPDGAAAFPAVPGGGFDRGEELTYKLRFSIFTVGKGKTKMYNNLYKVNGRPCYKMDIFGKTVGAVDWVADVDDTWGAYVDTTSLVPHITYRNISEGNFRKNEVVRFDHRTHVIETKVVNQKTGDFKAPEYYKAVPATRDMVSGLLFMRTINYAQVNKGDTLHVDAFFENTLYDFRVIFDGRETVKTKAGKFNALRLVPIMPDNKIFAGENSVTIWLSDDEARLPLKVEANMFIGKTSCELIELKNVKGKLNYAGR